MVLSAADMLSDITALDLPAIKLTENDWLRFELDPLTPYGKEVAVRELRETPEIKKKAIEDLRNLLQGNNSPIHSNQIDNHNSACKLKNNRANCSAIV